MKQTLRVCIRLAIVSPLLIGAASISFSEPLSCAAATALLDGGASENDRVDLLMKLAASCVHEGNLDQALLLLGQVIVVDPDNAIAYLDRGSVYAKKGEVKVGLEDLNRAIALNPNLAEAWNTRGSVLVNTKQLAAGISDLTEALRLKPDMALAYCNRGIAYLQQEDFDRAIEDLTAGTKMDSSDEFCYIALGKIFMRKRDYQKAVENLTEGIRLRPSAEVLSVRGQAYEQLGEREKAVSDYRSALEIAPSLESAKEGLERLSPR